MDKKELEKYKKRLLEMKQQILNSGMFHSREDLHVSPDDLADEADLAASVINQQVTFNMRKRELDKLRGIEEALGRIEDGSYGHCEECGELIHDKRLWNRPWTTLCITHAEEKEREYQHFLKVAVS